jgi:serine/threonine-protein kinase
MTVVGQHIGRYRILEQVGSGGMSVVYRGLDTALEREVAVKVLHPHLARKEDSRRRLTREAKAVAKLQHPNILEVFDFAAADEEDAYIVTEYIHGQTLAEYCARRPFDPPELGAMVIHQVACALAHAHDAGVIHRDLKPENVMIRNDGVIKLTDFGIAKVIDRDDRMTITGALVGSPAHMAPEIIEGQEAGGQADVFSLGTILYFLTARQLPFSAPSTTATLKRILDGSYPDPRSLSPAVSDELAEIIALCLARDPAARYPHAGKLRDALAEYLSSLGIDHVTEELTDYFADPDSYGPELAGRLCDKLMLRAETLWKATRPAKALSSLNHVLALQPTHAEAKRLLEQIDRARRRARIRRQRLVWAGGMAAAALLLVGAYSAFNRRVRLPDYLPGGSRLAEVQLPANAYRRFEPRPAPIDSPPVTAQAPFATTLPQSPVGIPAAKSSKPKLVKFTIQFRPYGYARVDGGPEGAELPHHQFDLTPGRHRLVYGCRFCEEKSTVFEVDGQSPLLNLLVQPKPAEVRFNVVPPDALVTIGKERQVASESVRQPFRVPFPPGVTQQRVSVQITRPGFKARTDVLSLLPSDSRTIDRILEPE